MTSYYIYYRVADVGTASRPIDALLAAVRERLGVEGCVLRKVGEPAMWMEVYEGVDHPADFEREIALLVHALDVERVLAEGSTRKVERFEPA